MKIYLASFKAKEAHRGGQYEIRSRLLSFHEISGNVFGAGLVYENILGNMASGTTARGGADQKKRHVKAGQLLPHPGESKRVP